MAGMAVIMKPTYACNACCDYCSIYKMGDMFKPMSKQMYSLLNQKLYEYYKPKLKEGERANTTFYWLGGEPLMISDKFYDFVAKESKDSNLAKVSNISHTMQSNITILAYKDKKGAINLLKDPQATYTSPVDEGGG